MNIELTEEMKREIINKTAEMFYMSLRNSNILDELLKMAKEKIANNIAADVTGKFHKKINVEDVVNKAVLGFEERINARITKTISKGIVVKLAD